ncbi:MAG TPA: nucleoside deaminase [Crinalium sp.]|jgi:tRNA(Arg) A34 adenosine deaminase TadA
MTDVNSEFMQEAIALSFETMRDGKGGPYGAVVVKDGKVIGRGTNQVTSTNDPTAHAELMAIQDACKTVESWQLTGCELYTSCEPCAMCMAAAYWAKLDRVYYGNTKEIAAEFGFGSLAIYKELALPLDQRSIPMTPLMQEEALGAFQEWADKTDKVGY